MPIAIDKGSDCTERRQRHRDLPGLAKQARARTLQFCDDGTHVTFSFVVRVRYCARAAFSSRDGERWSSAASTSDAIAHWICCCCRPLRLICLSSVRVWRKSWLEYASVCVVREPPRLRRCVERRERV